MIRLFNNSVDFDLPAGKDIRTPDGEPTSSGNVAVVLGTPKGFIGFAQAEDARDWLQSRGETHVVFVVAGRGRKVPVEWIGDGDDIRPRARQLPAMRGSVDVWQASEQIRP